RAANTRSLVQSCLGEERNCSPQAAICASTYSAHQIGGSRLRPRPGHVSGQLHQDDGSYLRSTLNPYVTAVIVNDLAGDCQSQAGAVVLRRANKRLKQVLTNRLRYAGAVVPNAHFEGVRVAAY